jgi:hypothetical protein
VGLTLLVFSGSLLEYPRSWLKGRQNSLSALDGPLGSECDTGRQPLTSLTAEPARVEKIRPIFFRAHQAAAAIGRAAAQGLLQFMTAIDGFEISFLARLQRSLRRIGGQGECG